MYTIGINFPKIGQQLDWHVFKVWRPKLIFNTWNFWLHYPLVSIFFSTRILLWQPFQLRYNLAPPSTLDATINHQASWWSHVLCKFQFAFVFSISMSQVFHIVVKKMHCNIFIIMLVWWLIYMLWISFTTIVACLHFHFCKSELCFGFFLWTMLELLCILHT
jgi:hypothetical protein